MDANAGERCPPSQGWLVTNTRFTTDALQYGRCAGLHMISWDFPAGSGLKDIIDNTGLYPVTCLTTLNRSEKLRLLENRIVLCKSLTEHSGAFDAAAIPLQKRAMVEAEARRLYKKPAMEEWVAKF